MSIENDGTIQNKKESKKKKLKPKKTKNKTRALARNTGSKICLLKENKKTKKNTSNDKSHTQAAHLQLVGFDPDKFLYEVIAPKR